MSRMENTSKKFQKQKNGILLKMAQETDVSSCFKKHLNLLQIVASISVVHDKKKKDL